VLYILVGEDEFSRSEALAEIKSGLGDPTLLSANTTLLSGEELTLDRMKLACETVPFLSPHRLVIAEGLLTRFESKGKSEKRPPVAREAEKHQPWADCLGHTPESTVMILIDDKVSDTNSLFRKLAGRAVVKSFPLLNKAELRQWLARRVREQGGAISVPAVDLMVRLIGPNLRGMQQEIDKLLLFAVGRPINEEDVRQLVSCVQEASIFTLIDAVLEGNAGLAEESLARLLREGASPSYVMVMLARQLRLVTRIKELKAEGVSERDIRSRVGPMRDFVFRKAAEQAARFSRQALRSFYQKLLEVDMAIKTGRCDGELALNVLAGELCQRPGGR
jgi:DNA polymerase-3 subunit delta